MKEMHLNNQPKRIVLVGDEADRTRWAQRLHDEEGYQCRHCGSVGSFLDALGMLEKDMDVVLSVINGLVHPPQKWLDILRDRTCIVYLEPPVYDEQIKELAHVSLPAEIHQESLQKGRDLLEKIPMADRSIYNKLCQKIDEVVKEYGIAGQTENFARHMYQCGNNGRKIRCSAYCTGLITFQWTLYQGGILQEEAVLTLECLSPSAFFPEMVCFSSRPETTWASLDLARANNERREGKNNGVLQEAGKPSQENQEDVDVEPPVIREVYQPSREDVERIVGHFALALASA